MELWIRSQDKYTLMKIEEIQICENPDGSWFMNAGIVLGKYKTKEKALEVLDEIQSILNLKNMYKYDRELVLKSWENVDKEKVKIVREQMSVYEMPKE